MVFTTFDDYSASMQFNFKGDFPWKFGVFLLVYTNILCYFLSSLKSHY